MLNSINFISDDEICINFNSKTEKIEAFGQLNLDNDSMIDLMTRAVKSDGSGQTLAEAAAACSDDPLNMHFYVYVSRDAKSTDTALSARVEASLFEGNDNVSYFETELSDVERIMTIHRMNDMLARADQTTLKDAFDLVLFQEGYKSAEDSPLYGVLSSDVYGERISPDDLAENDVGFVLRNLSPEIKDYLLARTAIKDGKNAYELYRAMNLEELSSAVLDVFATTIFNKTTKTVAMTLVVVPKRNGELLFGNVPLTVMDDAALRARFDEHIDRINNAETTFLGMLDVMSCCVIHTKTLLDNGIVNKDEVINSADRLTDPTVDMTETHSDMSVEDVLDFCPCSIVFEKENKYELFAAGLYDSAFIVDALYYHIREYFTNRIIDDLKKEGTGFKTEPLTEGALVRLGDRLSRSTSEADQEFYREHSFAFDVQHLLSNPEMLEYDVNIENVIALASNYYNS